MANRIQIKRMNSGSPDYEVEELNELRHGELAYHDNTGLLYIGNKDKETTGVKTIQSIGAQKLVYEDGSSIYKGTAIKPVYFFDGIPMECEVVETKLILTPEHYGTGSFPDDPVEGQVFLKIYL